jgi:hypothetical protein
LTGAALASLVAVSLTVVGAARSDTEPAPAGLATLAPNAASAPSHLKLDAEGSAGGLEPGKLPMTFAFAVQHGFTVNPQAIPGVCSNSQADNDQCPDSSRFATGSIDLIAHGPGFGASGQEYTADLALYIAPPQQAGDPAGAVFHFIQPDTGFHGASRGRIENLSDPTYGTEVRFDKLPLPSLPPGYSFDLKNLKLDVGNAGGEPPAPPAPPATLGPGSSTTPSGNGTTHHKKKKHRRRHKRHHKTRTRHHRPRTVRQTSATATAAASGTFLVNPTTCAGSWAIRLELGYSDGVQERDASAPCTT